jgi:hypothetical protein
VNLPSSPSPISTDVGCLQGRWQSCPNSTFLAIRYKT